MATHRRFNQQKQNGDYNPIVSKEKTLSCRSWEFFRKKNSIGLDSAAGFARRLRWAG
jgi:hypothetical protein